MIHTQTSPLTPLRTMVGRKTKFGERLTTVVVGALPEPVLVGVRH